MAGPDAQTRLSQPAPGTKVTAPQTQLVKAKTRKGQRVLEKRAPKLVEDAKRVLLLYGGATSQTIKDVMTDLQKLKPHENVRLTRKNEGVRPFEPGGEATLERLAQKADCGLFALGSDSKKRPHNLTLGRMYDGHLYDMLEVGVPSHTPIARFAGAALAQAGNKPCILFVGQQFESSEVFRQARSLLLDLFRGQQVTSLNLAGLDRVLAVYALGDATLLVRQYGVRLKKSGTRTPRVVLTEMGPRLELVVRRHRLPAPDLESEALKQAKLGKKKVKNVGSDSLDGKVGRIYVKPQSMDGLGLSKMKGLKRERREAAAAGAAVKRARPGASAPDSDDDEEVDA